MSQAAMEFEAAVRQAIAPAVVGAESAVRALLLGLLARGHILLEGPPGVGKTRVARSVAQVIGADFQRVQGTADLMPADIIGVNVLDAAQASFVFRAGPLFAGLLLFDEINRAGPRTQSALLEAMQERQVSTDRDTRLLAPDFLVVATQNPREFEGTFPLPESQLDRFLLCLEVPYPSRAAEAAILRQQGAAFAPPMPPLAPLEPHCLPRARAAVDAVHVAPDLIEYLLDLAGASRREPRIALGLSSRGLLAVLSAARATAALRGGEFVIPDDVKAVARLTMAHRLVIDAEAAVEGFTGAQAVDALLEQTPAPR